MSDLYTELWLAGPQSTKFYTRTYLPPTNTPTRAAVVFIHGFAEHVGRYIHFHPLLAARGIAVFAIDQRGFGLTALDTTGNKSAASSWGKTSWKDQMGDIDWALKHAKESFPDVPLFLMGHSMGGAEVVGFTVEASNSKYKDTLAMIKGVISTSPLIAQTKPAPALAKWLGGKASVLMPNMLIPAGVVPGDLSHDEAVGAAYLKDPLVKQSGSLRGISDMLAKGESLLNCLYKDWPSSLPLLMAHGTDDQVTSHQASKRFFDAITADNKTYESFEGGYHELQNEPDGVKEKLLEIVVKFIDQVISGNTAPARANL